jgi:hypothetical protein
VVLAKLLSNIKTYGLWVLSALAGLAYALFRIEQGKVAAEKLKAKSDALKASEEIRKQNTRVNDAIAQAEQEGREKIEKVNSDTQRRDFD